MRRRNNKLSFALLCSLLIVATAFCISFANPVWAEDSGDSDAPDKTKYLLRPLSADEEDKAQGVHKDPATFEKNFDLNWEQKMSTIKKIDEVAGGLKDSDASDLEKYYTLAIESNKIASYDWQFWSGGYDFDYYSHQWDSYGVLNERSVCVGIAIFYTHMCHAADLPCWFVRVDPDDLDHTISYIPDINGNAYYMDVTEDMMFMSEDSNPFQPIDKAFSHVTKDCTDKTFDYSDEDGTLLCSDIKSYYDVPFADWFKEYGEHDKNVTTKNFQTQYVEKGSGVPKTDSRYKHASYKDYRSNFTEQPDVWFLDDFYRDPAAIKAKIQNGEFDDQLVHVSGLKKTYDCETKEELEELVAQEILANNVSVEYFPSKNASGDVVPKVAKLESGTQYEITCTDFDLNAETAVLTVTGKGDYQGTYQIDVKLYSAVVAEDPVPAKNLTYNGDKQALVDPDHPGVAESGEMQYALGSKMEPTGEFSSSIPTATDAGKYYVWYKAAATDENHVDSEPKCIERVITIAPIMLDIIVDERISVDAGKAVTLSPKLSNPKIQVKFIFDSSDEEIATVDSKGVVTGVRGGSTSVYVDAKLKQPSPNYEISDMQVVEVQVREAFDITETKVRFYKARFTYNGKVQKPTIKTIKGLKLKAGTDYTVKWANASSKNAGTYKVVVTGKGKYTGSTDAIYTIYKAANPMTVKAKTVKVKRKAVKKKSKTIKRAKAITVSNAKGTLSYKLQSAKKGKKSFKKKFKVNAKTGNIKVKKGLKKGTYKVKIQVKDAGNTNYKASAWKTVTVKVRVK